MDRLNHNRTFILSIILIALGITLTNVFKLSAIGVVFIAVGGLFFIIAMARKNKNEKQ